MAPAVTRWISRYSGGRLSCSPVLYAGERGSPTRTAWLRSQARLNRNVSAADGLEDRREVVQQPLGVQLDAGPDEPLVPQPGEHALGVAVDGEPQQRADRRRQPVRQPVDRAEVEHDEPAVVEQPEVAGVRVGVQQPGPGRAGEQEPGEQQPGAVALLLGAVGDDPGQRHAVDPLGDQHLLGALDDPGDHEVRVAVVRRRERRLALGLQLVVELLGDPRLELGDQRLDVEARARASRPAGSSGRSG